MIKIKISELKEFLKRSRAIKPNPLVPEIFGRLLLKCEDGTATLSKTNLHVHCRHEIDAEHTGDFAVLIDEKMMTALIQNTPEDHIEVKLTKTEVILTSGPAKVKFLNEDPHVFHKFPQVDGNTEKVEFPPDVLYAIRAATSLIDTSIDTQFSYCYLVTTKGKADVFATRSAFIFYRKQFDFPIPTMPLSAEMAAVITMFENVRCTRSGPYAFFDCGRTQYAFVLSVYTAPPYHNILAQCVNDQYFEINRAELQQFCELVLSSSPSSIPGTTISDTGATGVAFSHVDIGFNVSVSREFEVFKTFKADEFHFNAKMLLPLLKTFESEKVRFSPVHNEFQKNGLTYSLWCEDDPGLQTLLSGLINQ